MSSQQPTQVSEQCIVNPAAQPSTLELGCSNIPSLAHGLHSARSASQLVHILQQLQVLAWQSDHGKHTIARQPGLLPRLLRLLHSDACTVAWYTAELLGFLSLQETLLQAILTTHHAALDASATLDAPAHDIHPHLAALVKRDVDEQSRAAAAWQAWLASLHPDQRPLLLQPHVLDTLARMLVQGASLATKLAATRVVRSVALAAVTWLDGAVQCQPALAQVLRRLLDIAKDVRQPCIARTAATSAVANLAAAGGEVLTVLVLRHGGVDAAVMLMMHHDMQVGVCCCVDMQVDVCCGCVHVGIHTSLPMCALTRSCGYRGVYTRSCGYRGVYTRSCGYIVVCHKWCTSPTTHRACGGVRG